MTIICMAHLSEPTDDSCLFDTAAWIALISVRDALSTPALRAHTIAFVNILRQDVVEIVPLSNETMQKGWTLYSLRPDKEWGLTDCTSFVIMQEYGIAEAFTSDHHFAHAGFTVLLSR